MTGSGNIPARLWLWLGAALLLLACASPAATRKQRAEAEALFTNHVVLRLALEISPQNLDALRKEPRQYVSATVREGTNLHANVALHLKGSSGSFRRVDDRPGFTVSFDHFQPDGRFHGLKKLHLNNAVQDPTRLCELVAGEMFRNAGVPAARAAHALVEFNGRRLGLYVLMESMNKEFLELNFKNPNGNLYGQSRRGDVTDALDRMEGEGPLDYADLRGLSAALWLTNLATRAQELQQHLDVDRFLSFMALEVMLGHWDGYTLASHNYRVYGEPNGRVVFLPHDLDQPMRRTDTTLLPAARGGVAQMIMNTPELRTRYQERVGNLATNLFVVPRLTNRVDQAVAALLPQIKAYDAGIASEFTNQAANLKSRIVNRGLEIKRQLGLGWRGMPMEEPPKVRRR